MEGDMQHIRCKVIIEVLGKPKEHVEKTIRDYIERISADSDLIILKKDFADATEQDDMWSTFVEMEMVAKGIPKLIGFCFDYMPSSVEILKPNEFNLDSKHIANFLNDLQARLHSVDMALKQSNAENAFLKRNLSNSVKNMIYLTLSTSPRDKEILSKITGIPDKELEIYLNKLIEEGTIKKEDNIYSLVPKAQKK